MDKKSSSELKTILSLIFFIGIPCAAGYQLDGSFGLVAGVVAGIFVFVAFTRARRSE